MERRRKEGYAQEAKQPRKKGCGCGGRKKAQEPIPRKRPSR